MAKDKLISYGLWLHEYFLTKQKENKSEGSKEWEGEKKRGTGKRRVNVKLLKRLF